jgi:hypothetical protein
MSDLKWNDMRSERDALVAQLVEARRATGAAVAREREAREMSTIAWAREERLHHQLSVLETKAGDAIANEDARLLEPDSDGHSVSSSLLPLDLGYNNSQALSNLANSRAPFDSELTTSETLQSLLDSNSSGINGGWFARSD